MIRRAALALLLLWPASAWAAHKAIPPSPSTYVHNEGVVSSGAEQRLSQTLRQFELSSHHQFVVALFQSLDGEALEDYTNQVFRAWKVGSAKGNDGLLFALYKNDRKWRVEVGYGLEGVITDLQAGAISREQGVPHFKTGDFDGGVQAIVDALIAKIGGQDVPAPPPPEASDFSGGVVALILFMFLLMALVQHMMVWTQGPKARNSGMFFIDFTSGGSFGGGGFSSGGGFGGGFSGGGGSSGGGGASGGW